MEKVAIYACELAYDGKKSSAEEIDLEFTKDNALHVVSTRSDPNWGNSSQIARMRDNFRKAARLQKQNNTGLNVVAINGRCCSRDRKANKGDYQKLCGERFWSLISGDELLYTNLIKPLGNKAREHNGAFQVEYEKALNRLTRKFIEDYCDTEGRINWEHVVKLGSATVPPAKQN